MKILAGLAILVGLCSSAAAQNCNVRPTTETSYDIAPGDKDGCVVVTNADSPVTVNLPDAAAGAFKVTVYNRAVADTQLGVAKAMPVNITSYGGLISTQTTGMLAPLQSATYRTDAVNWNAELSFPNVQPGAGLTANAAYSYSTITLSSTVAIGGNCTNGDVVGFDYSFNYGGTRYTRNYRHTMTSASTCLKDAAMDLIAQEKADTVMQSAIGADIASYGMVIQTSTGFEISIVQSYPFVLPSVGNPAISAYTSAGATEVVSTILGGNKMEAGAGFPCGHSARWTGREPQIGDVLCGMFFTGDTTGNSADFRNATPFYANIGIFIEDPDPAKHWAKMVFSSHTVDIESENPMVNGRSFGVTKFWTPNFAGTGGAGAFTYNARTSSYEQNGTGITARFFIWLAGIPSAPSGSMTIASDLPFSANVTNDFGQCSFQFVGGIAFDPGYTSLIGFMDKNSNTIIINEFGAGASPQTKAMPAANFSSSAQLSGLCSYHQ